MRKRIRYPSQAGAFYAGSNEALRRQIENCFKHKFGPGKIPKVVGNGPRNIIGLVCPHAGYMYSGPIAANSYYKLALDGKVDTFVILGPNHYGVGSALATVDREEWRTPLGDVEVDADTAGEIIRESGIVDVDESAHRYEHSIEVQIPFLQYVYGSSFKLVPICFRMQDLDSSRELGNVLAKVLAVKNAAIIASTDMTHYEPQRRAEEKDGKAIRAILEMDEELLYSTIESYSISACGYGPVAALITAAKKLNARKAELLSYRTSGDITGDKSSVVGYASVSFTR